MSVIDGITLKDINDGVWCAVSAPKVTGLMCILDHKDALTCDTHYDTIFLNTCSERENLYPFFFSRIVQWLTPETNGDR